MNKNFEFPFFFEHWVQMFTYLCVTAVPSGKKQVFSPYTRTGKILSNSMQQSPSSEADGHSATQEISYPLWNLKV